MEDASQPQPRRERLEPPPTSQLEQRLIVGEAAAAQQKSQRPRRKPAIKPVAPSGLLNRLQAFLPTLEAANTELQQQLEQLPASEVAMERGSDDEREGPYVEMDLACGLFDLKDADAVAAAERAMVNNGVAVETFDAGSSSDSDSDSDSEGSSLKDAEEQGQEFASRGAQNAAAAAAAAAATAAASGSGGGEEAMQEDKADPAATAAAIVAAGGAGQLLQAAAAVGAAGLGRRRKGKRRGSKRHAGIQEL